MRASERPPVDDTLFEPTDEPWQPFTTNVEAPTPVDRIQSGDIALRPADVELGGQETWAVRAEVERDWYVVLDELIDDRAVLVISAWPVVDGRGAPIFPEPEGELGALLVDIAEVVDAARRAAHQVERPLRIGDTFLVRSTE
ncbi:hypothetical protein B7486_64170, partial [cyanobacterium TDX16]